MLHRRAITTLALIAIPVVLLAQIPMVSNVIRTTTNVVALCLIVFTWRVFHSQPRPLIDKLLARTYLIGLTTFSIWLSLNLVVRDTYESQLYNDRAASAHYFCLNVEMPLVYFGASLAALLVILIIIKIFFAIRDHFRHARSLKANNV